MALAKLIRATAIHDDEERHDLANYTKVQAEILVQEAFSEPITVKEPVRFTFIIGGGKLVRQKYDSELGKWLTAALRAHGYTEDKSAALGSQGVFKHQHDLAQNLIYLHVFPHMKILTAEEEAQKNEEENDDEMVGLDLSNPSVIILLCTFDELRKIVVSRVPSWRSRRTMIGIFNAAIRRCADIEKLLGERVELSPEDSAFYNNIDVLGLKEKIRWIQDQMRTQVNEGQLTQEEFTIVKQEMTVKLDKMKESLNSMKQKDPNSKKIPPMEEEIAVLQEKYDVLNVKSENPIVHGLRGLKDVQEINKQLWHIDRLQKSRAGKVLTAAESARIAQRTDFERQKNKLLEAARNWFESDEEFKSRIDACLKA